MMKKFTTLLMLFLTMAVFAQQESPKTDVDGCPIFEMPEGDTIFTMKQYYFVLLKAGEKRDQDDKETAKIQEGHMAHLNKMADDGHLSIAGPFGHDGEYRGILIFNIPTEAETRKLVEQDPAFKAGRLNYEIYPWWGGKGSKLN